MKVLLLEPYLTGSHKAWAEGYKKHSSHQIDLLALPGNFWKWRMHGGAVTLGRQFLQTKLRPDFILSTDMLDLTTFLSLTRAKTAGVPTAVYFHENQLNYPWSPEDRDLAANRDHHYGFINFASALSADTVFFNSNYHRESYCSALPGFLRQFPDYHNLEAAEEIRAKSVVLPLGLELSRLDQFRPQDDISAERRQAPLILWNHRWEFDKNPEEFFQALFCLAEKGFAFDVAVLGECFAQRPKVFIEAEERLRQRVRHWGFVKDYSDYAAWLWRADILPVTSWQDFFGASVVEAIYCHTYPLLPDRLAYPELLPAQLHRQHLYADFEELVSKLQQTLISRRKSPPELSQAVGKFNWLQMAPQYDRIFEELAGGAEAADLRSHQCGT